MVAEGNRTVLAQQALDASDVIHMTFANRVVGANPPRKLAVKVPDGPSTSGGKMARQSITLAPEDGAGPGVMCGWLDVAKRQANLRSYNAVKEQFEKRFNRGFDVGVQEYRDLIQDLERTLRNLQITTSFSDATAGDMRASQVGKPGGAQSAGANTQKTVLVAVGIGLLIGLAVAIAVRL